MGYLYVRIGDMVLELGNTKLTKQPLFVMAYLPLCL